MNLAILQKLSRSRGLVFPFMQNVCRYSSKPNEPEIPKNSIKEVYNSDKQPCGHIYDKKPFKLVCEAGKTYAWCLCGRSKSQPLCDGTHRNIFWKIPLRPLKFTVTETKEYWLCNCKQTSNRPFCDGTHLREDIQEKRTL